jgi:hypothetical protein
LGILDWPIWKDLLLSLTASLPKAKQTFQDFFKVYIHYPNLAGLGLIHIKISERDLSQCNYNIFCQIMKEK